MRIARLSLLVALLGALGLAAREAIIIGRRATNLPADALLEGHALPAPQELASFLESEASRVASRSIYLYASYLYAYPELIATSLDDLGIGLDVERTLEQARQAPTLKSLADRLERALRGPPQKPYVVTPFFVFDADRARRKLERLAPILQRDAVNASLDFAHHRRIDDEPGRSLDIEATLDWIERSPLDEDAVVPLAFSRVAAKITTRDLPPIDVSRLLSSFETSFAKRAGARAVNIRRGAQLLDGYLLAPGVTFSFNRVVGPRTPERGFVFAPVIVHDEIDQGAGGGICQVASTLHAAAVYAGLQIVERRSHSRPSGYAPLGLDATVIDGKVDLRFRNPFDVPLMIHAFLATRTIRVEIFGHNPEGEVDHSVQVVKRYPFLRRIVEKSEIAPGEFKRSQKGAYGYDIISIVRLKHEDGTLSMHRYRSNYFPVPEVFWIGPGTPASALPPLPDGAEGLEPNASDAP